MPDTRKIALFGGTFDPVHFGHICLAGKAREELGLDEVRFLPCRISPHKPGSPPTSAEDRLEMLRRATADLPWAVVDDFDLRRDGPSFSYETAEAMKAKFPTERLFWMMGGDQWSALPEWRNPQRLAACVEFIVFPRGNAPLPRQGCVMHPIAATHPASATEIRREFARGLTNSMYLAPAVEEWILSRRLYCA